MKVVVTVGLHVHGKRTKADTVRQRSANLGCLNQKGKDKLKKSSGVSDAENPTLELRVDANQ